MRYRHFELLKPLCPVCLQLKQTLQPLVIDRVELEVADKVWQGGLACSHSECRSEFPIIDGVPFLLANLRRYISDNIFHVIARDDLSEDILSLLGDCCSQNSHLDVTRQHLSCYTWDHYGEYDPMEATTAASHSNPSVENPSPQPGSISRALELGLSTWCQRSLPEGPLLDAGCSVGRTAFDVASATGRDVLGIDTNFSMLRVGSRILRDSQVSYARRRAGLAYERRQFSVPFSAAQRVDFWVCDALAMPFVPGTFAGAVSMNLLDSVPSPTDLLRSFHEQLKSDGRMLLASPFDWSSVVTPVEAWLGGHSQRGKHRGDCLIIVRHLLTALGAFEIEREWSDIPWNVRMHDRSSMAYRLHMLQCRRCSIP